MSIKFPRVHIAESVLSRILDVRDELEGAGDRAPRSGFTPPPAVPDPQLAGMVIDAKVHAPPPADVPPLEAPAGAPPDDELAGMIARGDDLISA